MIINKKRNKLFGRLFILAIQNGKLICIQITTAEIMTELSSLAADLTGRTEMNLTGQNKLIIGMVVMNLQMISIFLTGLDV